mgnify:CR=1 FL=1
MPTAIVTAYPMPMTATAVDPWRWPMERSVTPVTAIGTDLAYAAVTKTVGGYKHLSQKTVDITLSSWMAIGSVLVGLTVAAPDPLVAQQIATHILAELNAYSIQSRHEQAVAERKFIERQLPVGETRSA